MSTSSVIAIGPPLSIRLSSRSSLTICARCSVSMRIFSIRSRIRAGILSGSASASIDRASASSETVVNGVRSSCDRLPTNSVRIRWSRRSSETSSIRSHAPAPARLARTMTDGTIRGAQLDLPGRPASDDGRPNDLLDPSVDERLDDRQPDHRSGRPVREQVGGRVRRSDHELAVHLDDAGGDQVEQLDSALSGPHPGSIPHPAGHVPNRRVRGCGGSGPRVQ
jgi:hypothetical protein